MNLYELNQNFQNLLEVMENTTDSEIKALIQDSLDQLQLQTNEKIENIIKYIKNLEYEAAALETEAKRLQDRKAKTLKKVDNLKGYLKDFTSSLDSKKYNAGIFKVSIRRNSPSLEITDIQAIPTEYIQYIEDVKVDKQRIKEAIKNGEKIAGVQLIESESILIK